ncbi:MAG: epimerase [Candidatus Hydrogenedentota bacterium]
MQFVIGGASGLIGSALADQLRAQGHTVRRLVRGPQCSAPDIQWDPIAGALDPAALNGADVLIHLSGENVAAGRWTRARKQAIYDSRVKSTRLLASALSSVEQPPQTWLCASAIGWYGSRGDEWVDEDSAPGSGFLAAVCRDWEDATKPASDAGLRVVNLRFAVVLAARGGAFKQMLSAFRLGIGGVIGDGSQYVSWIALEDALRAVCHLIDNPSYSGPVNIASPSPVTNRELTKVLGEALRRPTILPMPAPAVRLIFGEMADEMFLASTRVRPKRLTEGGFDFNSPTLAGALRTILG